MTPSMVGGAAVLIAGIVNGSVDWAWATAALASTVARTVIGIRNGRGEGAEAQGTWPWLRIAVDLNPEV
jgi:hypothetical protein